MTELKTLNKVKNKQSYINNEKLFNDHRKLSQNRLTSTQTLAKLTHFNFGMTGKVFKKRIIKQGQRTVIQLVSFDVKDIANDIHYHTEITGAKAYLHPD